MFTAPQVVMILQQIHGLSCDSAWFVTDYARKAGLADWNGAIPVTVTYNANLGRYRIA